MESNTNRGIHCKVACDNQFRRFLFDGTEFRSLSNQVRQVLNLGDKEFVLKYKDNEGDLISISTNEELASALTYSEGNVLRLTAAPVNTPVLSSNATTTEPQEFHHGYHHGYHHPHHPHHHPFYEKRGRRGGCRGGGRGWSRHPDGSIPFGADTLKMKLTMKREMLQSRIAEFDENDFSPEKQRKQAALQSKLHWIDERLKRLEGGGNENEFHSRKWEKKNWKHEKKIKKEKNMQVILSEEAQIEKATLKSQIEQLEGPFGEAKRQLKEKKMALKEVKISGGNTEKLQVEISELKEVKHGFQNQIKPMKKKIKELKKAAT